MRPERQHDVTPGPAACYFPCMRHALRFVLPGLVTLVFAAAAAGQSTGLRPPGIGEGDSRIRADLREEPWRGIGKLQATAGSLRSTCTGALIGPKTVLTAAHCVF